MSKAKLLACLVGAFVSCLLAVTAQSAEETYQLKTIVPVPGGLTSFDIAFVDANINTFVLADRTNKSIDVVNTATNTLTHQYTASFVGIVASPANASGPNGVIIVDQREIWATDGPVLSNCTPSPTGLRCTDPAISSSSIKVIDLKTGKLIANIPNGGTRRADELCEDVKHEVVLSANDDPADNFITFINTETYSIIGSNHKLDGTDANFKITLTGVPLPTHSRVAADGIDDAGGDRHVLAHHRRGAGDDHRVEMPVRRRRGGGEVGELGRPDRVGPEADHVVGQPDRMVAAGVVLLDHVDAERQRCAQEGCGLDFHCDDSPRRHPARVVCLSLLG